MNDISLLSLSWYIAIIFGIALVANLCQVAVFHHQKAFRTSRSSPKAAHVPIRQVRVAQSLFYASLVLSTSSFFVIYLGLLYAETRDFDSSAYWDGGPCWGRYTWLVAVLWRVVGYFSDTFVVLVLDYIYAATLNEMGLTGRSRQAQIERRIRDLCRALVVALLFLTDASMIRDTIQVYISAPPELRAQGCLVHTREAIFSTLSLRAYHAVVTVSWVYLSLSLLLLLVRNVRVAREARKRHLPSYELYRAALGRIRIIIYTNLTALGAIYAALGIIGPLETNLIQAPVNISKACQYTVYFLYFLVNGFAFLHRRSNASARLIKVTSPMMAAMESTFTPSAPVNDAVGSPSCL
jgi:hypothetical protein